MSLKGTISGTQRLSGNVIPRGNDGISPTIDIAPIEGGTRVTITDINGTKQFDVLGSISKEQIEELIRENLENNPPDFNESDPTVPAWAKQATKPKYTAEEVGALPVNSLQPAVNEALAQAKASGEFDDLAIVNEGKGSVVAVSDSINRPLRGLTIYGKTTQNVILGKNLFNDVEWFASNGFTKQSDGSWLCNPRHKVCWTNTEKIAGSMYLTSIVKKETDAIPMYFFVHYTDGTRDVALELRPKGEFVTLTMKTNAEKTVDYIQWTYSADGEYYLKGVMFSFIDNEYEPYTNGVASPSPNYPAEMVSAGASGVINVTVTDGTETNMQTLTVLTPNGLNGVPMPTDSGSGGFYYISDYIDENGNAYITDYIDFSRGIRVQRFKTAVITQAIELIDVINGFGQFAIDMPAGRKLGSYCLCSHYKVPLNHDGSLWSNPTYTGVVYKRITSNPNRLFAVHEGITTLEDYNAWLAENKPVFLYELAEPIEIPLTAEEIEAYKALHTNKPNTTVYNDGGAGLNVKYVADTKRYIDNKFNMLVSAIVNNA